MKKFLLKILIFTALLYSIALAYQKVIDTGLQQHYTNGNVGWMMIYDQKINQDIVILGSSRAWVQLNPKVIEDSLGLTCFNLGLDGARLQMQKTRWKTLLANGNKPKLVIQVVDYFALSPRTNLFGKERFIPWMDDPNMYEPLVEIDSSVWLDHYIPAYRYHGYSLLQNIGWKNYFGQELVDDEIPWYNRYNGFKGIPDSLKDDNKMPDKKFETFVDDKKLAFGRAALTEMMDAFAAAGIPVILVNLPIYHNLRNKVTGREKSTALFQEIADKYDTEFWDMSEDPMGEDYQLFGDLLHMNLAGANKLTLKLAKKISDYLDLDNAPKPAYGQWLDYDDLEWTEKAEGESKNIENVKQ